MSGARRTFIRGPLATPSQLADEPAAFPADQLNGSAETLFPDWQKRLTRNLARRSDGRWDPLTYVGAVGTEISAAVDGGAMDSPVEVFVPPPAP
jgi:hypothetical protein